MPHQRRGVRGYEQLRLPAGAEGVIANSVPFTFKGEDRLVNYPRLAVALSNVRATRPPNVVIDLGCAHYTVTEWLSATKSKTFVFDACQSDFDSRLLGENFLNTFATFGAQTSAAGGYRGAQYQPVSMHWSKGPQVAQVSNPPALVPYLGSSVPATMSWDMALEGVEGQFLEWVGYSNATDQRVWFYAIDNIQ